MVISIVHRFSLILKALIIGRLPIMALVLPTSLASNRHIGPSWWKIRPLKRHETTGMRRLDTESPGSFANSLHRLIILMLSLIRRCPWHLLLHLVATASECLRPPYKAYHLGALLSDQACGWIVLVIWILRLPVGIGSRRGLGVPRSWLDQE